MTFNYQKLKTLKREKLFCYFWRFGLPCHPTRCSIVFLAGYSEISTQLFLTTNFANLTAFVMQNVIRNVITLVTIFNKFSRAFYFIKISSYLLKIWLNYEYEWFSVKYVWYFVAKKGSLAFGSTRKKNRGWGRIHIEFPEVNVDFPQNSLGWSFLVWNFLL